MSYTIEDVNGCTKKIVFNFETLDLSSAISTALREKQQKVGIKGFRKGKVPLSVIENLYRQEVESEALNRFLQNEYFKAINDENLKVVGHPLMSNVNYESGKRVSFDALVEILPPVQLPDYTHWSFVKDKIQVTDEEVSKMQQMHLESRAEMVAVAPAAESDVTVQVGSFAVIDFSGEQEDGSRPENMQAKEHLLEVGTGQFIPGFEEGLIGMKVGEQKVISVNFPADYHVEHLRSAPVKFTVDLVEIKEKKYPALTDELALEFGFESVSDFLQKTREHLTNQRTRQSEEKLNQDILQKFIQETAITDLPQVLIQQQEESIRKNLAGNLKRQGFDEEKTAEYFQKWGQDVTDKAVFQIKSSLILGQLAKELDIKVDDDAFEQKLNSIVESSGTSIEKLRSYFGDSSEAKTNLVYALREELTFKNLISKFVVQEI